MRHGQVDVSFAGKLRASELHYWIDAYNKAGIDPHSAPPERTLRTVAACKFLVCSDLPRAVVSAQRLPLEVSTLRCDPIYREAGLPYANWHRFSLRPQLWAALFRALWYFGMADNSESLYSARHRASQGAAKLIGLAREHGRVVLVGHGIMNQLIANALLAQGWQGPSTSGILPWASTVYRFAGTRLPEPVVETATESSIGVEEYNTLY